MKLKIGHHALIELWVENGKCVDDILFIKKLFNKVIKEAKFVCVYRKYYKFQPQGITAFALLTTSHIAFHSWPEYNYANIEIYTCDSKEKLEKAVEIFLKEFKPVKFRIV